MDMTGWEMIIGAIGLALGGIITAFGKQVVSFVKAKYESEAGEHQTAITAYQRIFEDLRNQIAEHRERLTNVEKSEKECRAIQARQEATIESLRSELSMLRTHLSTSPHWQISGHVIENLHDAVIVIDKRGTIIAFSPAATYLFGWLPAEVIGKSVELIMPKEIAVGHQKYIDSYIETREANIIGTGRRVTAVHKNGADIPVELSVSVMEPMNSSDMYFMGVLRAVESEG